MLKNNILANLIGNSLTTIVFLICVPVYVKYLGVESYGLIGFFTSLQIIFLVLDAGLSATLNREFARLSIIPEGGVEQKNLLKTFETIYFAIALFIGLVIVLLAPFIARHWLSTVTLSVETVQIVLMQMGVLLALRWPAALYSGGLAGLQKQVIYNMLNTGGELVKAIGAIAVLVFINSSIITFFYWQIIISAIVVITLHIVLWKQLPSTVNKPIFSKALLKKNRSFAAGMGATTLTAIILTQCDKIILSKILNLENFGYYTLAYAIAASLNKITVPMSQAIYPRLVQLVHGDDYAALVKLYHTACQLIACLILPFALIIIFFSKEMVMIWTGNEALTEAVHPLVRVFIIGTACNALVSIPYLTQVAHGWTKLGLYQNIIAILVLIPSIVYLATQHGVYGAVWVWVILNASYFLFSMPVMYTKILINEKWRWYWNDVLKILFITLGTLVLLRLLFDYLNPHNNWFTIIYCTVVLSILLPVAVFSAGYIRESAFILYRKSFAIKVAKR